MLSRSAAAGVRGGSSQVMASASNASGTAAYAGGIALGGSGSGGGAGGDLTVNNSMSTSTSGAFAPAVLAQSIAGGGGLASGAASITGNLASSSLTLSLGGSNGLGADTGTVTLNNNGAVSTSGVESYGIVAQSIAGGGGLGGTLLSGEGSTALSVQHTTTLGAGAESGGGGQVTVVAGNNIQTTGNRAIGMIAQSIGGGGGIAGIPTENMSSASFGGTVTLGGAGGDNGSTVSASAINGWTVSHLRQHGTRHCRPVHRRRRRHRHHGRRYADPGWQFRRRRRVCHRHHVEPGCHDRRWRHRHHRPVHRRRRGRRRRIRQRDLRGDVG